MSQIIIKIKKLFQNKIFLNICGYTLAFAIGLFLASYVAEKQKNTIHSEQNQTEQQEVGKNRPDKDATFKIEKLGDNLYMVENPNLAILSDKYILQQEMNYPNKTFYYDSYQQFSRDKNKNNHLKIRLLNQAEGTYKDYDLLQLAQKLHPQAIPGKVSHQLYQDPQDSQLYFAFEVYLPGGSNESYYSSSSSGSFTQTLYTNIENGQTFSLDRYFEPLTAHSKQPIYSATDLDDKLNRYGLVLANKTQNITLIEGGEDLNIKSLRLSKELPGIEKKFSAGWSLMITGDDSYEKSLKLLAAEGEIDLYTNIKLDGWYSSDKKDHLLKSYQDFLNLYQKDKN